jgi:hypothetical protein
MAVRTARVCTVGVRIMTPGITRAGVMVAGVARVRSARVGIAA